MIALFFSEFSPLWILLRCCALFYPFYTCAIYYVISHALIQFFSWHWETETKFIVHPRLQAVITSRCYTKYESTCLTSCLSLLWLSYYPETDFRSLVHWLTIHRCELLLEPRPTGKLMIHCRQYLKAALNISWDEWGWNKLLLRCLRVWERVWNAGELSLGTHLLPFVSPFVYVACLGC